MNSCKLSVVIPSYNEMANLQKGILYKVLTFLKDKKFSFEVIVVDDGSTDGSREFVEEFINKHREFKLIKNTHTGKAGAVTRGMLAAVGEYVLFTDMDQATPIEEIEKLLPWVEKGIEIVIGSRNKTRRGAPFTRQVMANSMIFLRSILIGFPEIRDTQCGFKLFTKKSSMEIFSKINKIYKGYKKIHGSSVTAGFDIEILYLANQMGYKIHEVPVTWLYVETRRVNPIIDSIKGFIDLLRIKKNIISGTYN